MIEYRSFLNTDPPQLVALWNRLEPVNGLVDRIDTETLEQYLFSKQYFDREGLIVAVDNDQIIGFAHAGFSPNASLSKLDYTRGIISQIRTAPEITDPTVGQQLLQRCVDYCRSKGASSIFAGSDFPHSPFYLGFYGGSRHPGVIEEDRQAFEAFETFGFRACDRIIILELPLSQLKAPMGRQQLSVRRSYLINATADPLEQSWWESCTLGGTDRERFTVINKRSKETVGSVSYWDMRPMSAFGELGNSKARGLYNLFTSEALRRAGIASYLISESLKHLAKTGVSLVEAQTLESDTASLALFQKMGFQPTLSAVLMKLDC